MASGSEVLWGEKPDEHDYPAAADYLALLATATQISDIVAALKQAPVVHKKAKDLLRASQLALLPEDNPHVHQGPEEDQEGHTPVADPGRPRRPEHRGGDADRRRLPPGLRELLHRREHRHPGAYRPGDQVATGGFGLPRGRGTVADVQRVLLLGRRDGA